ncbi:MAG: TonB family protein [Candidatus Eisenbacteria bacterium]|uniref:TonB family protein n=1 Tax=Eiseniibacteriota bacterium TaxID=2212470 RepID=A0A956N9U3_UNCEI|nr:TonB family protein [Candidatus Eisenbacteria bacterium]MCB9465200.1 TonB family protein [Candidatus Eisenbacteria bacterium]
MADRSAGLPRVCNRLVLWGLVPVFGLTCLASLSPAQSNIERIQEIAGSRDFEHNRELCREVLANSPKAYAEKFCDGYEAIFLGMHNDARDLLEDALRAQSDFGLAALLYGRAYERLGDDRRAERYYERAIEVQPKRTDSRNALGRLYLRQARGGDEAAYPKALEAFRQMAETDPTSPDGFTNMAVVLTEMDRMDDAQSLMERALSKNPDSAALYSNLAALHLRKGEEETAVNYWRQSNAVEPGYGPAFMELASYYGRSGRLEDALRTLQGGARTVRTAPWNAEVKRNLGFALLGAGAAAQARDAFIGATTSGADDALSYLGLAHIRMLEGLTPEAVNLFRRGAALDPTVAKPFVLAWRSTLKYAVEGEVGPLADVLANVDDDPSAKEVLNGASGPDATTPLIRSVLGDWDFSSAATALEDISKQPGPVGALPDFDLAPEPIQTVEAAYPRAAKERGLEGDVRIRVLVSTDGDVLEAEVESSTADPSLADAAMDAVMKWKFSPAQRAGAPVEASVVIPFRFRKQ